MTQSIIPVGASMRLAPAALESEWRHAARRWDEERRTERLFARDPTVWTDAGEDRWLGWLDAAVRETTRLPEWLEWQRGLPFEELDHILLLGMGGSSLGPEVIADVLSSELDRDAPRLAMLDSTDPGAILRMRESLDPRRTLVVVSSKSGGTLETALLLDLFEQWLRQSLGEAAGQRLVAVTDPGSALETRAREHGFRDVIAGEPTIGGRFSVLSPFGIVPAAAIGVDLESFLASLEPMTVACRDLPAQSNPGVALGLMLAVAAGAGRDKVTLEASDPMRGLGAWLEQLLAESTGKDGQGLIPIDLEPPAPRTSRDRVRVGTRVGHPTESDSVSVSAQVPSVELLMESPWQLAAEFFRWQIATAVAGSLLGVDPFTQPDVEAAKIRARELTDRVEAGGSLDVEPPRVEEGSVSLFVSDSQPLEGATVAEILRSHFATLAEGDYFALLAFLDPLAEHDCRLQSIRRRVLSSTGCATTLGYGPRYLHSTGQLHKGGPNSGVFLVLTDEARTEVAVPGRALDFSQVRNAQALGDVAVLVERERRVVRVRLGEDTSVALARLEDAVREALA